MNADSSSGGGHTTAATATASGAPALLDRPLRTEPIRPTGDAGDGWGRAAAYDAYADGLHTYAIWSLRDHDEAVDALYCAFVIADRNVRQLRQPEYIQPWLYAILRRECALRGVSSPSVSTDETLMPGEASDGSTPSGAAASSISSSTSLAASSSPSPVSGRLRPPAGAADPGGSLASLERNLRRAEFHSLEWPESEGLAPAHREILELTIRHGLDSHGLGLVLGLGQSARSAQSGRSSRGADAPLGSIGSQGFGMLADAWRELERSLAAVAVAKASTEHCAQLAELTFGWSGRLNATLRAPLTDHVDGCTRCQHYLHTVIGTPAAPTILPFVAAPRALREIVLSELRDPELALRLDIDHDRIAARIQSFTPDGFPMADESSAVRRRGGRRAVPKRGTGPETKRGAVRASVAAERARQTNDSALDQAAAAVADQPSADRGAKAPEAQNALPRRVPGVNRPRVDAQRPSGERERDVSSTASRDDSRRPSEGTDFPGVYRAPGSWAARVLPPDSVMDWRPASSSGPRPAPRGAQDGSAADGFISTPTGRFAYRAPAGPNGAGGRTRLPYTESPYIEGMAGVSVNAHARSAVGPSPSGHVRSHAGGTARLPRFTAPTPEAPRGPDGKPRAQHRSRPMRQAMISAVTLGAVGAAAAATAALLGIASDGHPSQLIDSMPSQDPISAAGGGGLTVSVSTPSLPLASSSERSSSTRGLGKNGAPATGIGGTVHTPPGSTPGSGSNPGANGADFHVSVNQRDADPNSVTLVLRNSGTAPIAWRAAVHDSWVALSQSSGTIAGGRSQTITATATSAAPSGQWTSTITFSPGGAVVTLHGGSSNPSSAPASPPASGGSTSSAPPSSPPAGSTSTPTPTPSASGGAVGPSAVRPTQTMPAGGASASASPSSPASSSSPVSQGSQSSAPHSPRHAAGPR
ncbi:BACON domain-containing protein [Actinocrinis sp.]|uniref:BACON domain-containing protein n=1 Tax=Actinocrinis sp. TaxID=1920516 RepID=UPI002B721E4E|nr:hypothetical protein [Actinocrinis sp.]HXR72236.1 hypothetical protein [Actinocrinis sp.]